jgi:hypothetical protein
MKGWHATSLIIPQNKTNLAIRDLQHSYATELSIRKNGTRFSVRH